MIRKVHFILTAEDLKRNPQQLCAFLETKNRIYIHVRTAHADVKGPDGKAHAIANVLTGEFKFAPVATFEELIDACGERGMECFVYQNLSDIIKLLTDIQDDYGVK